MEFGNGAIGTLVTGTSIYPGYQRRVELTGAEGTLIMEHDRVVAADLRTPDPDLISPNAGDANATASSPIVSDISGHRRLIEDFLLSPPCIRKSNVSSRSPPFDFSGPWQVTHFSRRIGATWRLKLTCAKVLGAKTTQHLKHFQRILHVAERRRHLDTLNNIAHFQ